MTQTMLRDYLQETEDAISAGRIDTALANCQYILARFPESIEAQRLLGEVYLAQGNLEEARHAFDWVLTNDPENVIAYCDRALISERMSDYDTALDCYQQAYELSRGNSQIRQEFNLLSAKAGQQGFMFSRAGLARLYMRGDLWTQAIQEWEAVLAVTPDRLDARIGLLETYWHEGMYSQVEQLATQILQDVPDCLKALLLLAYVVSLKNISRAQEFLQRVEALDPDLLMAQELFMDRAAGQSHEPFLELLKRPPLNLEPLGSVSSPNVQAAPSPTVPTEWEEVPVLNEEKPSASSPNLGIPAESWQVFQEAQGSFAAEAPKELEVEPASWENLESLDSANATGAGIWEDVKEPYPAAPADPWANPFAEPLGADPSAPPAWLSMLTQSERQQLTGATANSSPSENHSSPSLPAQPAASSSGSGATWGSDALPSSSQPAASTSSSGASWKAEAEPATDDEEASSFGPEWLRSIGATALNEETTDYPSPSQAVQSEPQQETGELWKIVAKQSQPEVAQQTLNGQSADPVREKAEQNLITTLEELEHGLLSQGFTQLEPNSLASIAQAQEASPAAQAEPDFPIMDVWSKEAQPEPTLSSALAELGSFSRDAISTPSPVAAQQPENKNHVSAGSVFEPVATWQPATPPPPVDIPPVRSQTVPGPVFEPKPVSAPQGAVPNPPTTAQPQHKPTNPFLDNELETTMRRPAVRLQPMQQKLATPREQLGSYGRGSRNSERVAKSMDGNVSYQERLLKGYQYQLAGDYDDAMQAYRVIIRSAPELLGEVVSNVRALLKLAPNYSAGYRVLGDAYMRQGEYLQAMEAYNKALTMAKKARS
ncbi:MAG TPA: tetratricopeptide repeat protein [Ktedonobacteraceae bacterium]|nr:tetratricopeptide repeat protein [Ktedonobacteraceae bacterium]